MSSLLTLPNELLQHIASCLPFSALLKLQRVNHRLHSLSCDRVVLQNVVRHGLRNTSGAVEHILQVYAAPERENLEWEQLRWGKADLLLDALSLPQTMRAAYAVERCIDATMTKHDEWTLRTSDDGKSYDFSRWLPQLLALHHPAALGMEPDNFLRVQGEASTDSGQSSSAATAFQLLQSVVPKPPTQDFVNINFVLVYVTLQRLSTTQDSKETIRLFEDFFFPTWTAEAEAQSREEEDKIIEVTIKRLNERVPQYSMNTDDVTAQQASAALVSLIVGLAVQFPTVNRPSDLPKPLKMPFHNFMDILSIFEEPISDFATCHLRKMTSPEFIAGRWRGYYSDHRMFRRLQNQGTFDPPMCDVRISTREPSSHDVTAQHASAKIDRQSRGVDSHGEFALEGTVHANGSVKLAKRYIVAGWSWAYTGYLTPFGIVGIWGRPNYFGGYFWLWKEEWC